MIDGKNNQWALSIAVAFALGGCGPVDLGSDEDGDHAYDATADEPHFTAAVSCAARLDRYPVNGPHNGGYDSNALTYTCSPHPGHARDNTDYYSGGTQSHPTGHFGNDIFGARHTPIVAARAGTVVRVSTPAQNPAGGNAVTVRDGCGWDYYYAHLQGTQTHVGAQVSAGTVVGTLGNSGNASGTSTHLHFSIYPAGNYNAGVDPFPYLQAADATACGGPPPPPPATLPPPVPPTGCGEIRPGHGLGPGQAVHSCDGRFALVMQGDGNLVLYQGSRALWATGTNGRLGYGVYMQGDGNLVLYTRDGVPLWHTRSNGRPGAFLAVQSDGNAVVYQGSAVLWASNTCCR